MIMNIRYGEEEGNFHIIIVNDDLEEAYIALRYRAPNDDDDDGDGGDDGGDVMTKMTMMHCHQRLGGGIISSKPSSSTQAGIRFDFLLIARVYDINFASIRSLH